MSEKNWGGRLFGIAVFLGGIGLLGLTFKFAWEIFASDPAQLFKPAPGKNIEVNTAGAVFLGVIVRILLLALMAGVGGAIAKWGVRMYADSARAGRPLSTRESSED